MWTLSPMKCEAWISLLVLHPETACCLAASTSCLLLASSSIFYAVISLIKAYDHQLKDCRKTRCLIQFLSARFFLKSNTGIYIYMCIVCVCVYTCMHVRKYIRNYVRVDLCMPAVCRHVYIRMCILEFEALIGDSSTISMRKIK